MAGQIAIGIITVIHSRGDRDLAAIPRRTVLPMASGCGQVEPTRRTIDPKNGSVGWVERGETITAPMADGVSLRALPILRPLPDVIRTKKSPL
jgi:hypothetical protein